MSRTASATVPSVLDAQPPVVDDSSDLEVRRSLGDLIRDNRLTLYAFRLLAFVVLLAIWQLISGRLVGAFWISSPGAVAQRIGKWLSSGYLLPQVWVTVQEALLGFVVGAAIGVLIGVLVGYLRTVGLIVEPVILAFYSLPVIALAPLYILWFGIGEKSKVFLSATTVLFIVFFNTYSGVREVDQELVDCTRLMGASKRKILLKVIVPSSLQSIFTGFKVALPFALIGAVVAELVSSDMGIGYVMQYAVNSFDTTGVFVGLLVIALASIVLGGVVRLLEGVLLRWKPSR